VKMPCSYLPTTVEWILSHGRGRLNDRNLRLQLLVFNCCLFIAFGLTTILALVFIAMGHFALAWNTCLPFVGLFGVIYLFLRQRHFLLARVLFLLLSLAIVTFGVWLYGKQSHLSLYCIDLALLPFLIFCRREWRWTVFTATLAFLVFSLLEAEIMGKEHQPLAVDLQPYAFFVFSVGAFVGAIFPFLIFYWQLHAGFRRTLHCDRMIARDEKFAAIGRLAAGAAHEINNPLAIVQLSLERIGRSTNTISEGFVQHYIECSCDAVRRIHQILQKLRASTLVPDAHMEYWWVHDVALAIGLLCRRILSGQGIELSICSDLPENCRVFCHRQSVIDVVESLINNSLEAIAGQGNPRIVVTLKCEHLLFIVQVEDSGPGVSEKISRSVFTPFFTTKDFGHGLGLSLYSARCIAQQYGGDLTCDLGPGGRFYLSLPIELESETLRSYC